MYDNLKQYSSNHDKGEFVAYCHLLGMEENIAGEIYRDFTEEPASDQSVPTPKPAKVPQTTTVAQPPKPKKKISITYDDLDVEVAPKKPKTTKFKKINKEDALKFKEKPTIQPIAVDPEPELDLGTDTDATEPAEEETDYNEQWYVDDYEPVIEEPTKPKPRFSRQDKGGFYRNGEYVDFDHESNPTIPVTSHFFVPPFLKDEQHHLKLQIGGKIMFDPIKNHDTHLSIISKKGSDVVNERRSKKERIKQAKERADVSGTRLGNVLGIEEQAEKEDKTSQQSGPSENQMSIEEQRKRLPVFTVKHDLIKLIGENQVSIIIGETGSGKTTQLTQYLHEAGYKNVVCTQPRRVAAMSVAQRVSVEMGCKVGQEVGYSIRFEDVTSDKTRIKYMTEGILLRELLGDSNLDGYDVVIMDEAHERSLNTDVLLGLLRMLVRRRRDLKVIITSATINADFFSEFFGGAPQFTIPGRTFPVEVFYNRSVEDYVEETVKTVVKLHLENLNYDRESDGDILVFMTGQEDIEVTCELVAEKLSQLNDIPPLDILPIYSSLPSELQSKIFTAPNKHRRKCVVATNIAETSLTVDGVKYVVDCGLIKLKIYNAKLGMDNLTVIPISIANGNQRSGRAGRTGPGKCYRLYSEQEFNEDNLNLMPIPEIKRTNLSNVMLLLKSLKINNIHDFPFIDAPPKELISCSMYELWTLGAIDNFGNLTALGKKMISFPMEPSLAKLIIVSTYPQFQCSNEIIIIVSMLSVPPVYYRPKERLEEADMMREKFTIKDSDHLTLLNIYQQWESQMKTNPRKVRQWCIKNFLIGKSLQKARDIKNQLLSIMKSQKLPITSSNNDEVIKQCLCMTFFPQSSRLSKINLKDSSIEYFNLRHSFMKLYLHPTSVLNNSRDFPPDYVIYHQLILTKKEYMNVVTAVDPLWLVQYGYMFYDVPKKTKELLGITSMVEKFQNTIEEDTKSYNTKPEETEKEAPKIKKFKPRGI
ncbi:pre-mRNA-splicing factor ATP-dependent RNA helicase Prp16p [[Candida] jaroonii]|uniref:Pre-mRNA-splicing factor ATP-dependent RNA helicase Prp16p n=1 Tax=[Candida] jaroonii TaxID=467808 RepID=A0ACA9Y718_9ASCO|nr:pre-mRNA-splicing factor ATP-dependent RNA helicase Prp16p [[Candida] jaroonii]